VQNAVRVGERIYSTHLFSTLSELGALTQVLFAIFIELTECMKFLWKISRLLHTHRLSNWDFSRPPATRLNCISSCCSYCCYYCGFFISSLWVLSAGRKEKFFPVFFGCHCQFLAFFGAISLFVLKSKMRSWGIPEIRNWELEWCLKMGREEWPQQWLGQQQSKFKS